MINSKYLKVNEPNVVHETIEGEAILLDLNSGNYFSLDGLGAKIWDYLALTGNWAKTVDLMVEKNTEQKELISTSIEKFVEELVEEKLLVSVDNGSDFTPEESSELEKGLIEAAIEFKAPVVNKYSDMQDLLLLDPIHDVDEKGWPEAQESSPEDPTKQ